ncbi:unnamed protein product [Rodentolepis nana]|uniref:Kin17_mid domain-containing protein n=1 Tax=Rodentolepis nana TaxID=102285 RepID=A0A158QHI7_RODNA|nr:unnamed protein product [Rodentolepis nana]
MGKDKGGFLTPKAIANRIKSKGLQKLRWYCQMCQKQCRDENGYKCHTNSEAHHRQMKIFMENGGKFISSFSSEFLKGYLDIVRRQFGGKRVHANVVYQEYIKDKEHVHMNATRWHSLTGLCMWLHKQGICRAEETEKGWYIEYIDRDPEAESRKASDARLEKTEDELNRQILAKQIEKASNLKSTKPEKETKDLKPLVREDENEIIRLDLQLGSKRSNPETIEKSTLEEVARPNKISRLDEINGSPKSIEKSPEECLPVSKISMTENPEITAKPRKIVNPLLVAEKKAHKPKNNDEQQPRPKSTISKPSTSSSSARLSALDELMAEEEMLKEKRNRKDYWLAKGIEVKLIYHKLPRHILYRHAIVLNMEDSYTAVVQVLNSAKTKLKIDQDHAETVIPPVGSPLLVVNGAYRGEMAILKSVDKAESRVDIAIDSGLCRGRLVKNVSMEDVFCWLSLTKAHQRLMDSVQTILVNVLFASAIKQTYVYFTGVEIAEIKSSPPPVEIRSNWEGARFSSEKLKEPSWFLPIALAAQLSIIFTFLQNLSKRELPRGRIRYYLVGLIVTDLLLNLLNVLQLSLYYNYDFDLTDYILKGHYEFYSFLVDALQMLSGQIHIILCGEYFKLMPKKTKSFSSLALIISLITGFLTPLTFKKPPALIHLSNFMEYRNSAIDVNYIQRLNCFHLCPCLVLAIIFALSRGQEGWNLLRRPKELEAKGDSESCVLKMRKFILQSMALRFIVSIAYALVTLGIKTEYETLINLISKFDTSDNPKLDFSPDMALRGYIVILKRDGTSGSSCEWRADKCIFGSDSSCDICIKLNSVEPFHCKLENSDDGRVFIINVAKFSRTLLNGLGVSDRTFVAHNSLITVGDRNFTFKYPETSHWRLQPARSSVSRSAQSSPLVLSSNRLVADVSKLPTVKTSSPNRPHLRVQRSRTPTLSSQRSGLSTRDRYCPTPTRPAVPSPDVNVKRRSILKKRTPSLEALVSPVRKKAKVLVLSETPILTGVQYIKRLRRSSSLDSFAHSNNSASFYSTNQTLNQSGASSSKLSPCHMQKKGVQFGPRLSPEQFDSRLPPATPLKRGDLPPSDLNARSRHHVKKTPGYVASPALILNSPMVKGTPVLITPKSVSSPSLSHSPEREPSLEVATPGLSAVRKILKTPSTVPSLLTARELVKSSKSPSPGRLSTRTSPRPFGLRNYVKTPELQSELKLSAVHDSLKSPSQSPHPQLSANKKTIGTQNILSTPTLSGVCQFVKSPKSLPSSQMVGTRNLLKTSKVPPSPRLSTIRTSQPSPKLTGVREILNTSKSQLSPKLSGVRELLKTPKSQKSPILTGVRELLETPGSQPSPKLFGIRELMKTPKSQKSPRLIGVRELLKTPCSQPSPRLSGVRKLMKTPKSQKSPRLTGVRKLVKTPKSQRSPRYAGLREMFRTPKSLPSPRLSGVKELFRTSNTRPSPRLSGIRELMRTPKSSPLVSAVGKSIQTAKPADTRKSSRILKMEQSPKLAGIREMMMTPKSFPSPRLSGIKDMIDLTSEGIVTTNLTEPATPKRSARRAVARTRKKAVEDSTADETPIRITRGRRNPSRPVDESHTTVNTRATKQNPVPSPEVIIDLEEDYVEPISSLVKTNRGRKRAAKKTIETVVSPERVVRSTRRKRNLSPTPITPIDLKESSTSPKRARTTRKRAAAKNLTEARVATSTTAEARSTRKRPVDITVELGEGGNVEPTSSKRPRSTRRKAAEKTNTTQANARKIDSTKVSLHLKESEASTPLGVSASRKRTTRSAKVPVEKAKEAETISSLSPVGRTVGKKRTITKSSTVKKTVGKSSPVVAEFGRTARKVHFKKSVSEITRKEEVLSLKTPVRRTRSKAAATKGNDAALKSPTTKSPRMTPSTKPVRRTRSKK